MKNFFKLLLIACLILFALPDALWAVDETSNTKNEVWGDLFSGIIGRYPIRIDEIGEGRAGYKNSLRQPKNWEFDIGLQRFLMSHTSYEIGNDDPPFQKPLSRLEFPLNTWWLDLRVRRTCPRWSAGLRSGFAVAPETDGCMRDSDWENPNSPQMLTTLSESACRMEKGFHFRTDVDVNISDWLGIPSSFEVRPLFAFQFQRFVLTDHDGVQWTNGAYNEDDEMELDGNINSTAQPNPMINFRQDYYLYQIGARGSYTMKLSRFLELKINGEADWGPAVAFNEDHHIARPGALFGYIKSSGNSMYFTTGFDVVIAKTITAGIEMDYSWIRTTGETRHYNAPLGQNFKWTDGVKAWSDQTSLIARISYAF